MSKNKDTKVADKQIISNLIEYIEEATRVFEFEYNAGDDGLKFTKYNANEYSITLPVSRRKLRFLITFE
tara:strand:- start:100 stop:306 length:207 start_codon:yes stop_codon:yes gene_type:complete